MEFGERVFYYNPNRLRSKLVNRWRLGVYLSTAMAGNEKFVSTANGNGAKSRSVVRIVSASRWDAKLFLGVKGRLGKQNLSGVDEVDAGNEDVHDLQIHGDEEGRAAAEDELREPRSSSRRVEKYHANHTEGLPHLWTHTRMPSMHRSASQEAKHIQEAKQ